MARHLCLQCWIVWLRRCALHQMHCVCVMDLFQFFDPVLSMILFLPCGCAPFSFFMFILAVMWVFCLHIPIFKNTLDAQQLSEKRQCIQSICNVSAMYPQCIQPRIGRRNRCCYLPVRAKGYGAEMNRRKWNFITFHWNFSIFVYKCTGIIGSITDSINMGRKYTEFSVYTKKNCFSAVYSVDTSSIYNQYSGRYYAIIVSNLLISIYHYYIPPRPPPPLNSANQLIILYKDLDLNGSAAPSILAP